MGTIEEKVFSEVEKPPIYCRYIDDVFITVDDHQQLQTLIDAFKRNSVLNFTCELENDRTLPFLDVKVTAAEGDFKTSVYTKSMNLG